VRIAHLALELRPGHERGNGVDDDDVDGLRLHEHLDDVQCLLAAVGLRQQQVVGPDAELSSVAHVQRMLGVDERADAARLLCLRYDVQRKRGLPGGLGPVHLHNPPSRQTACSERDVDAQRAGRDDRHLHRCFPSTKPHDGSFPELLLDLSDDRSDCLLFLIVHGFHPFV